MKNIWYVIADSSHATVFSVTRFGGALTRVHDIDHPMGRAKAHDLVSDRQGAVGSSATGRTGAFVPHSAPNDVENRAFARRIATFLDDARTHHSFDAFALAMPPRLLGMVRDELPAECKAHLIVSIDDRLVDKDGAEISERFREAWLQGV
jgi:protein required for attachment to host cells